MTATPAGLVTRMLREAFEGPPGPWTYFTDTMAGTGVFDTLGGVTAAQASKPGGPGHTTIAAHAHHMTSSLAISAAELRGESVSRDRSRSWNVSTVDETEWDTLRARVREEYEKLLAAVRTHASWDDEVLGVAMGAVAHTAYHLGAIRQRL
ncbi:MAG TPA: DinB family protein [Candidatus Binatia bacterium]|nr:DinB family protein [Candidatus Binatia bacterium]